MGAETWLIFILWTATVTGLQCTEHGCGNPFRSCPEARLDDIYYFNSVCRKTCITRDCEIKCQDTAQEKLKEEGACD